VFENFRQSLQDLFGRGIQPHERSAILASMKQTLVQAKAGIEDLRSGLSRTRARLGAEEKELDTVRRRKALAEGINDAETVGIAVKYEKMHADRIAVLSEKVRVQESELALVEREVAEMTQALKSAMAGVPPAGTVGASSIDPVESAMRDLDQELRPDPSPEIDALGRAQARANREAEADRRLEELKRRMGQ
jgi:hypothetical protein